MFAIITWSSYRDVSFVLGDDVPLLFLFRREAEHYAEENLSGKWEIIYLY